MKTQSSSKKIYCLAAVAMLLLSNNPSNAQDTDKKETQQNDKKKKEVTRIIIYKDEDGKTTKIDTTIMGDRDFEMEAFAKNFNLQMPELPDLNDLPEPPEPPMPPMPPDDNFFLYHFYDHKMTREEKEELKNEVEHMREERKKSGEVRIVSARQR